MRTHGNGSICLRQGIAMNAHTLVDTFLWIVAGISFIEHCVWASRKSAPKRNRILPTPSILCERTGNWRVNLPDIVRRQGE